MDRQYNLEVSFIHKCEKCHSLELCFNFSVDKSATFDSKRVHIDNLFRMIQYCENVADCRRAQLLHYFGEHKFDRSKCSEFRGAICDNCVSKVGISLNPLYTNGFFLLV